MDEAELHFMTKQPDYNHVLADTWELGRRVYLHLPKPTPPAKVPLASLGYLDKLSTELQYILFASTPITELFRLRAVNSHAKTLIEEWPPCITVLTYAPLAIPAMLATSAGKLWTVPQLVDVIFKTKCEFCGENGEIVQLLRLERCCFRCLSQERDLLAIPPSYAINVMGLTDADLQQIPHIHTIPQKNFWGAPSSSGPAFDYKAAMDAARQRHQCSNNGIPWEPANTLKITGMYGQGVRTERTGLYLLETECSIQHRSTSSIQMRRHQPPLHLLEYEVEPPETFYLQHACSVQLPVMEQQSVRLPDGTITVVDNGVCLTHCAGCASYWNYHCPLPWRYHRLYRHQSKPRNARSELTEHLANCLYARLHWTRLWNPWGNNTAAEIIDVLAIQRRLYWARNPRDTYEESNAVFEQIDARSRQLMLENQADCHVFTPRYSWPKPHDEAYDYQTWCQRERVRRRGEAGAFDVVADATDHYWDSLVSQEAISQAHWATAKVSNGSHCLFRGLSSLLAERRELLDKKFICPTTRNRKQPPYGFDRF